MNPPFAQRPLTLRFDFEVISRRMTATTEQVKAEAAIDERGLWVVVCCHIGCIKDARAPRLASLRRPPSGDAELSRVRPPFSDVITANPFGELKRAASAVSNPRADVPDCRFGHTWKPS